MDFNVTVSKHPEQDLKERILLELRAALKKEKHASLVLSGGSTPGKLYEQLTTATLDWKRIHIFFADERYVPADHQDSNYRMINETLLKKINIPPGNIHPVPTQFPLEQAVKEYEKEILKFFAGQEPRFDLILLGLGKDGHTASLFPQTLSHQASGGMVLTTESRDYQHLRVTLSLSLLNKGKYLCFLAKGKEKAEVIKKVLTQADQSLPASRVKPESGLLHYFLDHDAAALWENP